MTWKPTACHINKSFWSRALKAAIEEKSTNNFYHFAQKQAHEGKREREKRGLIAELFPLLANATKENKNSYYKVFSVNAIILLALLN